MVYTETHNGAGLSPVGLADNRGRHRDPNLGLLQVGNDQQEEIMEPENRVVIVTGAGTGLGYSIAAEFARQGARVVAADVDRAAVEKAATSIGREGGKAVAVQADVSRWSDVQHMATEALTNFGRIDVLVNNAGVRFIAPFLDMDIEQQWQRTVDVNLTGPMLCCRAVIPQMLRQGRGKIINIASVTGMLALTPAWPTREPGAGRPRDVLPAARARPRSAAEPAARPGANERCPAARSHSRS